MLHVSQLIQGGVYKLDGKTVKLVSIYINELFEPPTLTAIIVYDTWFGTTKIRSPVKVNSMTDFEELTPLEKELL